MLSYQTYKVVHIWAILIFITSLAMGFSKEKANSAIKFWAGLASLFILVGGMGMMARIGIKHSEPFPIWITIKLFLWGILAFLSPIFLKRLMRRRSMALVVFMLVTMSAVWVVVNQHLFL